MAIEDRYDDAFQRAARNNNSNPMANQGSVTPKPAAPSGYNPGSQGGQGTPGTAFPAKTPITPAEVKRLEEIAIAKEKAAIAAANATPGIAPETTTTTPTKTIEQIIAEANTGTTAGATGPTGGKPQTFKDRANKPEDPEGSEYVWISLPIKDNPSGGEWRLITKDKGPGGGAAAGAGADAALLAKQEADKLAEEKRVRGQSAYNILLDEFTKYGLQSLIEPLKSLITSGASSAEFSLALQNTEAYKKRFSANADRITKGFTALNPAEYLALEDAYQKKMMDFGLPASYYSKDSMGKQSGFDKLLANDISGLELEDRLVQAQTRVINANPVVTKALKQFYPDINNGDILAYTLDPTNGIDLIKRKVSAAEIGGAALAQGLNAGVTRAEQLAGYGVDKASATEGYSAIGGGLQRGSELASIYGENPYTQATAESEVFKLGGATEARKQRQKVTGLEKATFGGQTGITQGALARNSAGAGAY